MALRHQNLNERVAHFPMQNVTVTKQELMDMERVAKHRRRQAEQVAARHRKRRLEEKRQAEKLMQRQQ